VSLLVKLIKGHSKAKGLVLLGSHNRESFFQTFKVRNRKANQALIWNNVLGEEFFGFSTNHWIFCSHGNLRVILFFIW